MMRAQKMMAEEGGLEARGLGWCEGGLHKRACVVRAYIGDGWREEEGYGEEGWDGCEGLEESN